MEPEIDVPPFFLCPISLEIMKDPVTISTGITYDRENIEKWVFTNNNPICPVAKQPLTDTDSLTPNHTLRRLIQSWCTLYASYGIERFPTPKPPANKAEIMKLIQEASNHPKNRPKCLNKLRSLAFDTPASKRCLEAAGVVDYLLGVIVKGSKERNMGEIDIALSVLSQLQISEDNLQRVVEESDNGGLIDALTKALQRRCYESQASAMELMKSVLQVAGPAKMGALKRELFEEVVQVLVDKVSPKASKSALKVLTLACPWGRNRVKAAEAGAVSVVLNLLLDTPLPERQLSEMSMVVLEQLCGCAEGRAELLGHRAGLAVVSKRILRVSHFATERGVKILWMVARFSGSPGVQEMVEVGVVAKLCLVLQLDCESKTKEMVKEVLKLHGRAWRNSPCAPQHLLAMLI